MPDERTGSRAILEWLWERREFYGGTAATLGGLALIGWFFNGREDLGRFCVNATASFGLALGVADGWRRKCRWTWIVCGLLFVTVQDSTWKHRGVLEASGDPEAAASMAAERDY